MNRIIPPFLVFSVLLTSFACSACKSLTRIENRRDLYLPQTVWGPYTYMLHHGVPKPTPLQQSSTPDQSDDGKDVVKPQN